MARIGYWDRRFAANGMGLSLEERRERDLAAARDTEILENRLSAGFDPKPCPECGEDRPDGAELCAACAASVIPCPACGGEGEVEAVEEGHPDDPSAPSVYVDCVECNGEGTVLRRCPCGVPSADGRCAHCACEAGELGAAGVSP